MKGFLSHYTPSLMNPEDLDAIFVQRDRLLTDLLENIENSILTEAKHHALLIGPRGIGKTHLISMIYHRVSANEVFQDKLKIAWLREEEWGIATFLDLLVRILNSLMEEYKDPNLEEQVKGLYSVSTEQAEQLAGHILKQYCQDKTLLLLMENLDEIFKGLDESGQQAFRAYLQNYGFITIVATSQSLFKGVQSRNLPFYGFFSPTHLKPLVLEEAIALLVNIAKWRGDQELADLLITPLGKSRIRAIHHLAGGNHRIYIIFSQFLTTESLDSLVEPFMKTLDDLTPFYQSRMQFISPQQRKIIEYLCEQRGAIAVKEIAQHCFITPQTASSQLKQLREMGYVYADSQGRESFYELQEPLMRICLEAKKRRGTPNQLFISFLRVWFSREELENRLKILPLGAIFDRECTLQALAEMETSDDPKISALLRDWNEAWKNSNHVKMLELSEELIAARNFAIDWIKKADSYYCLGKIDEVIIALDKATEIEPENSNILTKKGILLMWLGLYNESLTSLTMSTFLDPKNPLTWSIKAIVEAVIKNQKSAIDSVNNSIKFSNEDPIIFENLSLAYGLLGDYNKSIYYAYKGLNLDKNNEPNFNLQDKNKVLEYSEKSVDFNHNSAYLFQMLPKLHFWSEPYKNFLHSIDHAIASDNSKDILSTLWGTKGHILFRLGILIESLRCFNNSLLLDNSEHLFYQDKSSGINAIKTLSKYILTYIFASNQDLKIWLENSQYTMSIYNRYNLLNYLSLSLVLSVSLLEQQRISDHTAQAWLEMWKKLAGNYSEFKVALNLLKVAVEYKIHRDRRVLLQLPQEERQILEELLNPETV
jgi:tetratricopeptide (TPR) repeat protein